MASSRPHLAVCSLKPGPPRMASHVPPQGFCSPPFCFPRVEGLQPRWRELCDLESRAVVAVGLASLGMVCRSLFGRLDPGTQRVDEGLAQRAFLLFSLSGAAPGRKDPYRLVTFGKEQSARAGSSFTAQFCHGVPWAKQQAGRFGLGSAAGWHSSPLAVG